MDKIYYSFECFYFSFINIIFFDLKVLIVLNYNR